MITQYIQLGFTALIPVAVSALLILLETKTPFRKLPYLARQIFYGLVFGGIAILGTEYGIPLGIAQINTRDAAPLCAGLFFGGPAGIIAGLIGGIERWLAVAWGVGTFTRTACSVSTIVAGIYAALLRRYVFDNRRPSWALSLVTGVVMEVFHLIMVFLTNFDQAALGASVVKTCTVPMVTANGLSVMLASLAVHVASGERKDEAGHEPRISSLIQRRLLICVVIAFTVTTGFLTLVQTSIARNEAESLLRLSLNDVESAVEVAANEELLDVTRSIAEYTGLVTVDTMAGQYGVAEINVVSSEGIITESNDIANIGYVMASGEQSAAFLCLLNGEEELVQEFGPISRDADVYRKYAGVRFGTGFVQVGYNTEQFRNLVETKVSALIKSRHIGQNGSLFIADIEGHFLGTADGMDAFAEECLAQPEDTLFTLKGEEDTLYGMTSPMDGFTVIALLPWSEAFENRNVSLYVNTFMEIMIFAAMFLMIYILLKRQVVNKLRAVNHGLSRVAEGNLDNPVNVHGSAEFSSLTHDINATVDTMKGYIAEAEGRMSADMAMAKEIQHSALPGVFPAFPRRHDFDIYASMDPARDVGGDFYDFYLTGHDRLHFLVADVSGKGIPAAMFMMRAKTQLKSLAETDLPIDEVFTRGNTALCEGNDADMFVTAWMGSADLTTGLVEFANAGHNPPLLRHADGRFEYLRGKAGFILAGMDGIRYKKQQLQLAKGDTLFLYTDGVTEATDPALELYGEQRLQDILNSSGAETPKALCEAVRADVDRFVNGAEQFDDITMLAFTYVGPEPEVSIRFENASIDDITAITEFAEEKLEAMDCPMKVQMQINIAIDEIYSNIVKYAYGEGSGPITVSFRREPEPLGVHITFTDTGKPYNPVMKEDPDVTLSAEEREIGGLGIFMVKKSMDDMSYEYHNEENILRLFKKF